MALGTIFSVMRDVIRDHVIPLSARDSRLSLSPPVRPPDTKLTEAVVYLQSLVNVREAMRASSSSIAPMAVNTSSEAWGPSQSLAASQVKIAGCDWHSSRVLC